MLLSELDREKYTELDCYLTFKLYTYIEFFSPSTFVLHTHPHEHTHARIKRSRRIMHNGIERRNKFDGAATQQYENKLILIQLIGGRGHLQWAAIAGTGDHRLFAWLK